MSTIHRITISPPLMNSSCAWASDQIQLKELFDSKFTGAVTTRTATLGGFAEDAAVHTVAFAADSVSSLNSYGYSPHPLSRYLDWTKELILASPGSSKPIVISITASLPTTLSSMVDAVQKLRAELGDQSGDVSRIAIELNTSCPNIVDAPPPAYAFPTLIPLLIVLADHYWKDQTLTIGLKLPPYVHRMQFVEVLASLTAMSKIIDGQTYNPIAFLTCTNTLGSSILFQDQLVENSVTVDEGQTEFALPTILGGVAGELLHPLALGNVFTFKTLLTPHPDPAVRNISIIGVGGVTTPEALVRMRRAGATVCACATLLGREGVSAFEKLAPGLEQ